MIEKALALTERLLPTLNMDLMGSYCRESTRATLEDIQARGKLIVKDNGLIGGHIGPSPINSRHKLAVERVFWFEGKPRSLIKEFELWGAENGANATVLSCFNSRVGELYERLGYSRLETYYVKES